MDLLQILNVRAIGWALFTAAGCLALGMGLMHLARRRPAASGALGRVWMPLSLAAGFVAGYAGQFRFPQGTPDRPWFLDQAWMMTVVAAAVAGVVIALARLMPRLPAIVLLNVLACGLALITVRGPWMVAEVPDAWQPWQGFAGVLAAGLAVAFVGMLPAERSAEPPGALWLVGAVVMWLTTSVAAVSTLQAVDQTTGKMLVMLAVFAGLAAVAGIVKPLRVMASGAGLFLVAMFGVIWMLVAFYDRNRQLDGAWPLTKSALLLIGCGPLGGAVAWIPALRRRPWVCLAAAVGVTALFVVPGVAIAHYYAPALPE